MQPTVALKPLVLWDLIFLLLDVSFCCFSYIYHAVVARIFFKGGGFMWKASWSLVLPMYPCAVKWCLTRRNLLRTTEKKKEKEKPPSGVGKTKPSVSAEDARRLIQPAPVPPNPGRKRKKKNPTPHSNQQSERNCTLFSPALLAVLALYSSAGGE